MRSMKKGIVTISILLALSLLSSLSKPKATLLSTNITQINTVPAITNPPQMEPATSPWQTIRMRVTAYCPCEKCCGRYADGITASGHKIQPGETFAAADKRYPFGTEMIIPGYNNDQPVKILDRGSAIQNDRIDIFFPSHEQALKWGVKYLDVKILNK